MASYCQFSNQNLPNPDTLLYLVPLQFIVESFVIMASTDFILLLYMVYVGPGAVVELVTKVIVNSHLKIVKKLDFNEENL